MAYGDPTGVNKILVEKYGYEWVNGKAWRPGTAPEPEPIPAEEPVAATPPEPSQPAETPIEEPTPSEPVSLEERIEQLQASLNELQKKYEEALEKLEQANARIAELEGQQSDASSDVSDDDDTAVVPEETPTPEPQQPAEADESEAVTPESNSTEVTVRNNELDLNNEYFSADFQVSMNRSEVLRVDGYDSDILIMVMAASTNSESTLFNTEAIPTRAMAYDDVNGLVEVSSEILVGNPKSVLTRNIILGDYDGNGHVDVFLNNHGTEGIIPFPGETNQLLLNLDGKLVTSEFNLPTFYDFSHNGSSGDYNNDGYDDVFIINFGSAGLNADYVLFGSKQGFSSPLFLRGYTPEGETLVPGSYSNYASQMPASVSIDIGQDGYDEMVGPLKIQASDDTPQFIGISLKNTALAETTELGISWRGSSEGAHQARTADLNGDGYQDGVFLGFTEAGETLFQILLSSKDGIIDGNSGFGEDSGVFEASQGNLDFKLIDYDSDGDLDILFRSWDEHWQPFGVGFQNDGNAQFTKIEFPLLIPETVVVFDIFQSNDESQLLVYGEGAKISAIPSKLIPSSEVVNLQPTPVVELTLAEVESAPTGVSKLLVENYGYSWIEGQHYRSGSAPEVELEGDAIHTVTVSKIGNQNVFFIDGNSKPDFIIEAGKTYRFDQSDASNANHPLNFLSEAGSDISSFIEVTGIAGTAGAYVDLRFEAGDIANIDGPELSYYCEIHGAAMGNEIEVQSIIA